MHSITATISTKALLYKGGAFSKKLLFCPIKVPLRAVKVCEFFLVYTLLLKVASQTFIDIVYLITVTQETVEQLLFELATF